MDLALDSPKPDLVRVTLAPDAFKLVERYARATGRSRAYIASELIRHGADVWGPRLVHRETPGGNPI
jgi:hypothetical protein